MLSDVAPDIHPDCDVTETVFGRFVAIGQGTRIAYSAVGDYAYCDRLCDIANAQIGKFANIASAVRIGATDHPMDRASLHHFMYRSQSYWPEEENDAAWFGKRRARQAIIGHDTWIGHNAQIKPDIVIGHGAIVASGAVVTKSVEAYSVVAGVPAKPIRRRQPAAIADRLIALGWWDWDHGRLRTALPDFRNLPAEAFLEKYED